MASESRLPSVRTPFSDTIKILQHSATGHTWTIWLWNFSSFRIPIVRFIQELAEKQLRIFSRNFVGAIPGLSVLWSPRGPPSPGSSRPPFSRVPPSPTSGNNKTTVKIWNSAKIQHVNFKNRIRPCLLGFEKSQPPFKCPLYGSRLWGGWLTRKPVYGLTCKGPKLESEPIYPYTCIISPQLWFKLLCPHPEPQLKV